MNQRDKRTMKSRTAILLSALLLFPATLLGAEKPLRLYGSGATLPAPLYLSWLHSFNHQHPEIEPDYQGISSTGGIKDLIAGRVDFAGADYRISKETAAKIPGGLVQLPIAASAIALVYNLPGITDLTLSREAVLGIFNGTITQWNDPLIAKTNPDAKLPDSQITLVARASASGTSYNLSRHLSAISPEFQEAVGSSLTPNWPELIGQRGRLLRGSGNDGVATLVKSIPGTIGYVAYPYSHITGIPTAAVENNAGKIVAANPQSFAASMKTIGRLPEPAHLVDPPGEASYPMIALSWLLVPKDDENDAKQQAIIEILEYAISPAGQDIAERIGYIPLSPGAIELVREGIDALK
jgi:phosphate transport system substrate-binding protein